MGRFLDEEPIQVSNIPNQQSVAKRKGRFLDEAPLERKGRFVDDVSIPKKESIGRVNLTPNPLTMAGPTGLVLDTILNRPESLPAIGQAVGGRFGGGAGAVIGSTIGDAGQKSVEFLKTGKKPSATELGLNTLITSAIEGVTRGTGNLVFRRQLGQKELKALGAKLGQMKEAMRNNPQLKAASKPILDSLENAYNGLPDPLKKGKIPTTIRRWIEHLKKNPDVSAGDLIDMEQSLGEAAEFGVYKKGAFQPAIDIPNPRANAIAKAGRAQTSNVVDNLAESSGQKGFKETSKKVSKLLRNYADNDPTKTSGGFAARAITGLGAFGATQNPLVGLATYYGSKILQSPELRNAAFKVLDSTAGRAASDTGRIALSSFARKKIRD